MAVLTRIKNNQITDATITGTKLVDQTITSNLFAANLTLASNITVLGNFAVTGTPTTINSINTYINDPLVVFNNGYAGSLSGYDIGMLINRNLSSLGPYGSVNTAWVWVENDQAFEALATTDTGTGITSINNSGYANVKMGNATAVSGTITASTTSTNTLTGALIVSGGAGINENLNVGNYANIGGALNVVGGTTFTTAQGGGLQVKAIGNLSPGTAAFTTVDASGYMSAVGVLYANSGVKSTTCFTGAIYVPNNGGIGVTGNINVQGGVNTFGAIQNTPIGNATPNSGDFTTITTTSTANVAGIARITNSTQSTSTTTGALIVTGGAGIGGDVFIAGNLNVLGVGTTTTVNREVVNSTEVVAGNLVANSGTVSTNTTTGAIVVPNGGGVGITGNLNVGNYSNFTGNVTAGNVLVNGNLYAPNSTVFVNQGQFFGNAAGFGALYAGISSGYTYQAQTTLQVSSNFNGYAQINSQNINSGALASSDYIATANNGTASDTYIDMGIASSNYSYPGFGLIHANDGYLLTYGNTTTGGGNLLLGTANQNSIIFATNGFDHPNEYGRINANSAFTIMSTVNASPAVNTGALQIAGGQSTLGNVYFGNAAIFNGSKTAGQDFIVKGKNDNTLIWGRPNATYDTVIIGNSATASTVVNGAKLNINSTDSIVIPYGPNSQRPSSVGFTDTVGMIRFNTTIGAIEWYDGSAWGYPTTNFTIIQEQQFNGDGSTTVFTLASPATTASILVSINGVLQIGGAGYAYTLATNSTQLTFTQAPAVGDVIDVRILTTTQTVTSLSSSAGYVTVTTDDAAGITFNSGTNATTAVFTMPPGGGMVGKDANITVASANTLTTLDSFSATLYRSAKYMIQVTQGTNFQVSEARIVHNGTTATSNEYGVVTTNGNLGIIASTITSGTVYLQFIAANASTKVRLWRQYLPI